jgi:hypothetical protein
MTEHRGSIVARRLAKRVADTGPDTPSVHFDETPVPDGLFVHLRKHLVEGETHYTARPGIPELRAAIGRRIRQWGGPDRDAESVIVTHGEGEALYVSLLGLGVTAETTIVVSGRCRHLALLDLLDIAVVDAKNPSAGIAQASYRELGDDSDEASLTGAESRFEILSLGGLLFSADSPASKDSILSSGAIVIGHLDSVPGLDHFRLGYVAGPAELVKRIQTWKQALSICTAGPSQRAALFAIEQEHHA